MSCCSSSLFGRSLHWLGAGCCATYSRSVCRLSRPGTEGPGKARLRTASARHSVVGCRCAPRPGAVQRDRAATARSPEPSASGPATTRSNSRLAARSRHPTQVRMTARVTTAPTLTRPGSRFRTDGARRCATMARWPFCTTPSTDASSTSRRRPALPAGLELARADPGVVPGCRLLPGPGLPDGAGPVVARSTSRRCVSPGHSVGQLLRARSAAVFGQQPLRGGPARARGAAALRGVAARRRCTWGSAARMRLSPRSMAALLAGRLRGPAGAVRRRLPR